MVAVGSSSSSASWKSTTAVGELDTSNKMSKDDDQIQHYNAKKAITAEIDLSFNERAFSAAGAAFISAIIVNPLDLAKTRLQAQAAGVPYNDTIFSSSGFGTAHGMLPDIKRNPSSTQAVSHDVRIHSREGPRYKGTLDVLLKVVRQEGFTRLWRGTNASLALAVPSVGIYMPLYDIFRDFMEEHAAEKAPIVMPYVPLVAGSLARTVACITCYPVDLARTHMQAFRDHQRGTKPPGILKTLVGVISPVKRAGNCQTCMRALQTYRFLWTGLGAQLARDVPFSAICWSTLEPVRRRILGLMGDKPSVGGVLGANFCVGFIAGSLAAAATCPLDVARTRRQIEKDHMRALRMTTRQTLIEIWRDGGLKGLFTGVSPRVARAGPSVGIVVSCYEVVKYALQHRHLAQS